MGAQSHLDTLNPMPTCPVEVRGTVGVASRRCRGRCSASTCRDSARTGCTSPCCEVGPPRNPSTSVPSGIRHIVIARSDGRLAGLRKRAGAGYPAERLRSAGVRRPEPGECPGAGRRVPRPAVRPLRFGLPTRVGASTLIVPRPSGGMADALDSKSSGETRVGSSPTLASRRKSLIPQHFGKLPGIAGGGSSRSLYPHSVPRIADSVPFRANSVPRVRVDGANG